MSPQRHYKRVCFALAFELAYEKHNTSEAKRCNSRPFISFFGVYMM